MSHAIGIGKSKIPKTASQDAGLPDEPHHDHEAHQAIRVLKKHAAIEYAGKSGAALLSAAVPVVGDLAAAALFATAYTTLYQVEKFARLDILVGKLLKDLKGDSPDIKIYPCLKMDEGEPLDIYIKVHQKANILISIRSKSKSKIIYDQEKQWIYSRRRYRGRSRWKHCPMEEMNRYVKWLTKNRALFRLSSRHARNLPLIKIVVIWSPTEIAEHDSENYCYMKGEKILTLNKKGKVYFMGEDKVIDFIKACLANEIEYKSA